MGKNNSVKKIDEEQILKRFEYTVQEYIRFYDFYKNQEVSEENTEAFYVMLQTKLMILRKYDYNRVSVLTPLMVIRVLIIVVFLDG